jgi:hypothetical protein
MPTPAAALLKPQVAANSVSLNSAPVPQPEPVTLAVSLPPAMEAPVQIHKPAVLSLVDALLNQPLLYKIGWYGECR